MSKDALSPFLELQRNFIARGAPRLAELVLTEEIEKVTPHDFDDLTFFWHLTHLAYIFLDYGYSEEAERLRERAMAPFRARYDEISVIPAVLHSRYDQRLSSLVNNTRNELALQRFNSGKVEEALAEFQSLEKKELHLNTTSQYFDTLFDYFYLMPDAEFVQGHFIMELRVRHPQKMPENATIRFWVEAFGVSPLETTISYERGSGLVVLRSQTTSSVQVGPHTLIAEINGAGFPPYQHRQSLFIRFPVAPNTPSAQLRGGGSGG